MKYFLDTNIISFVMKRDAEVTKRFRTLLASGAEVAVPAAAYYEVKRGLLFGGADAKTRLFEALMQMLPMAELTKNTCDIAAKVYAGLRRQGNLIEDADIFIAASSMEHEAMLVTSNARHMQRIEGLMMETW